MSEKKTGPSGPAEGEPSAKRAGLPADGMKRITLDLPLELHRAIKLRSFDEGTTMAKLIRECLEECFQK